LAKKKQPLSGGLSYIHPGASPAYYNKISAMKRIALVSAALLVGCCLMAQKPATTPIYKNPKAAIEDRVQDLLERMTIEEKAGQLNQLNGGAFTGPAANDAGQQAKMDLVRQGKVGSFLNVIGARETRAVQEIAVTKSRLGIPIIFGYDVIHGYKTVFPIPLAEACSFDLQGIEKNSSIGANEAAAAGIHWAFAPMCDISNDPRWGRVMEGAGEDPYYGALVAAARVKGLQGDLTDGEHILACVKHYAAYGAVEAGREYNTVDVSRVALWNKYLPTYKGAVDAGAATVMNSFNIFEGVPASGNAYLVKDILKTRWGFKGFMVSDWNSFGEMINHGYALDKKDVALKAIKAGSMMDMETHAMVQYIPELVKEGKVSIREVNDAVGRILYYKFKLGLFEDPYRYSDESKESRSEFTPAHRLIALEAARRSIVLLKNEGQVLPLQKSAKLALVGYLAESHDDLFDFWIGQGNARDAVTILEGLQSKFGPGLSYSKGYNADGSSSPSLISEAVQAAGQADVIVVNIGISGKMAGEDRALANPVIPEGQLELLKALAATGKPVVALVSSGRPLVLTPVTGLAKAIVQCWILGTETGPAVADVLTGEYNPSAKTVMSFPYAVGQIPVYYNHLNTNRPLPTDDAGNWFSRYRDIPNDPLFPFGFGLSYTSFSYKDLTLSSPELKKGDKLEVIVTVTNTGKMAGEEVAQLYIRDYTASIVRPVKELKGFQKISLQPGESKTLHFSLGPKELSFFDGDGNTRLEPGKFSVFVGGDSKNVLEAKFDLK
jgi:beta-glucosidase